jgi:LacI family transcriptional regulator
MKKAPSLQDIADALGVSKMTVSLALRKHPRISDATRKKIEKMATEMGYIVNPDVAKYMSAIRHNRSDGKGLPLAYLTTGTEKGAWRQSDTERHYWEGATMRAKEYGYYFEEYWLGESGMSEDRMSNILWNRGISGVVVSPFYQTLSESARDLSLKFNWDQFIAVAISDMLRNPILNRVLHDHYTSALTVMESLIGRGYQRIGLCLTEHMDLTVNQRWQAAYRVYRANHPIKRIEPLILPDLNAAAIKQWAKKNKLDAIISAEMRMPEFFNEMGLKMGKDIAYADLDIDIDDPHYDGISGIYQNSKMMGTGAVDLLIAGIQRNEPGVPKIPVVLQVEGNWHDRGSTPSM